MTQDLKFWPSAVVEGSFIITAMTCSQTGGMEVGSEAVIKVGMVAGVLEGGVEASAGGMGPEDVSGDTRPLGVVDDGGVVAKGRGQAREKVPKNSFLVWVRVGMRGRYTVHLSVVESHDRSRGKILSCGWWRDWESRT